MNEQEMDKITFEGIIAELEDPRLRKTLADARRLDEEFRFGTGDSKLIKNNALESLNNNWTPWMEKPITAIGSAHRVLGENNDIRPDPVTLNPEDTIISEGFSIVRTDVDSRYFSGNPYGEQNRIVHGMQLMRKNNRYEQLIAFIDSHDVQSEVMSTEYAEQWLWRTQLDFLQHVNDSVKDVHRPESKLVRIGTACEPGLFLDIYNKKNRIAVEAYLNELVQLDTKVPYMLTTKENKSVFEDDSDTTFKTINKPIRVVGKVSEIFFQQMKKSEINNNAGDWWLSVRATVYGDEVSSPDRTMVIPLRSIKNMRSLREIGYESLQRFDYL